MKINRRNFVQGLGAAAAITISLGGAQSILGNAATYDGKPATSAKTFFTMKTTQVKAFVGSTFLATSQDGQTTELILFEVNEVDRPGNIQLGYSGECFSAIFVSRSNEALDQDVYTLRSAKLDDFAALLVPTGRRAREYEMIVNRLTQ